MHFSIPDTVEHSDHKGIYTTYEVHLNGVHHCSVRYRQLYSLHENLRKEFQPFTLPTFPPKKLLPLTLPQVEERRLLLEKYLQLLSQDPRVISALSFNGFLLGAQQETYQESLVETSVEVFLMNEHKILIRGLTIMQTEEVLERVCQQLGVPDELAVHFSLYLVRREGHHNMSIVRKLQHFEVPYISAKNDRSSKLVLRKCSWDPSIDDLLLSNPVTLNLLYIQTVSDVEMKWIQVPRETEKLLARMQARGAKDEYMETARGLTDFGYTHFLPCFCDYQRPNSNTQILIGHRELVIRVVGVDGETKDSRFRVTKMRCWKIMTLSQSQGKIAEMDDDPNLKLELSFEYLMSNDEMKWITIISSQAIIMSLSLQSIVEEMLRLKSGTKQRKLGEKTSTINFPFLRADGSEAIVPVRTGTNELKMELASLTKRTTASQSQCIKSGTRTLMERQYSVKKLSEKFSVINMRTASRAAENVFIENEVFQELKDEEL